MEKLNRLLSLNLEIEGLLRTLIARPQAQEAMTLLIAKNAEFQDQLSALAEPMADDAFSPSADAESLVSTAGQEGAPDDAKEQAAAAEITVAENLESKPTIADNISANSDFKVEDMIAQREAVDLSRAFSINDKFRFIRDLFGNNKEKFDITMQRVVGMKSLSQAYEYFLDELAWDADDPAVSDFLAVIANHFNSAQ